MVSKQHKPPRPRIRKDRGSAQTTASASKSRRRPEKRGSEGLWLYGKHAVLEALDNPERHLKQLLITQEVAEKLGQRRKSLLLGVRPPLAVTTASRAEIAAALPATAVHQGIALETRPLKQAGLEVLLQESTQPDDKRADDDRPRQVIVALDRVTDPQNVGAILRTACAFGALGIIVPRHHAAPETGALAKAASGALEHLPYIPVPNLARALEQLKKAGFWAIGLDAGSETPLPALEPADRLVLVMGAEGPGLRRLTREACDLLVRLPTRPPIDQLNVANAAAVALYELLGRGPA